MELENKIKAFVLDLEKEITKPSTFQNVVFRFQIEADIIKNKMDYLRTYLEKTFPYINNWGFEKLEDKHYISGEFVNNDMITFREGRIP